MAKSDPEPVTAVWLRKIGDRAQVLVEIQGRWYLVAEETIEGQFSHITEARVFTRTVDPVTEQIPTEDCGYQDVECWKRQLLAAGWTPKTSTIWRSPDGLLHVGPHGAWKKMRRAMQGGSL